MKVFDLLQARRKRNAIKKYITDLGPLLARTYGKADYYSPDRVRTVIQINGFPSEQTVYALVLYCTPEKFAKDQKAQGGKEEYWPLRVEIMEYNFRYGRDVSDGIASDGLSSADNDALAGYSSSESGF